MAQSIAVDREVSVTPGNGVVRPRAASSAYSLFHHQQEPSNSGQQNNVPGHRPRAKSHSNLVGRMEPEFEFQDNTLIDEDGNFRRGGSGIAELIDFLRNHAPPSDNFMSIPDESNDSKGKWAKIRKLAKRKSKSKLPDPITLPDSAVSGITTEGHRHIAISIPLDASPFGRSPRTQYPVYQNRNLRPPPARYGPTRAILNEKGVVTVLRTVTEDQEISAPSSPAIPRIFQTQPSPGSEVPRGPSVGNSYSTSGAPSTNNGHGKVSDYFGVSSSPPRTQPQDQFRRANDASRELQQQNYGQSAASSSAATRADGLPIRGSSLPATRFVFPPTPSIDAMMFEPTTMSNTLQVTSAHARDNSKDGSYQESLSKSILTSSDNEPVVADAKRVTTTSLPLGESPVLVSSKKDDPSITVITRSPLASDGHISPTASIHSTRSQTRRDKVRDKKRRDMEALRTTSRNRDSLQSQMSQMSLQSQQSQQSQQDDEHENKEKVSTDLTEEVSMSPKREKPPPLPLKSANRPSLCAIMVVSDVQPSPPQSAVPPTSPTQSSPAQSTMVIQAGPPEIEPPLRSPPLHGGFPKPPKTKPQFRPKPIPRVPSISGKPPIASPGVSFNNTSNPTPPQSVKGSPKGPGERISMQSSVDRTSKQSSGSVDRTSKQSSVDRMSKQSSVDRMSKQSSIDRLSKHGSIDRTSKPQSPIDQPAKHGSVDRTSLSRRREWNATREQERKNRNSRMGSRQLPRPLVMSMEDIDEPKSTATPTPTDKDMSRRYDVYREYRIREMECRLRRLERNGDVWLRALVPVLENLNRTLAHHQGDGDRAQGWVSDEDLVGSLSPPRGRASFGGARNRRSRMMPRPGVSEREFLEHLVRTKEELEAGNNSDDMSGFDTIEPLMRELAGRSRLSFEARTMAFAEDDELMFRGF